MSGASNRSSNDSEWVILTPRGDDDSDGGEEPEFTRFVGGTQNPRPATNPRPRPPRQRTSGLDSDFAQAAEDWYAGPSGPPIPSEWRRESSSYGLPEYPSSASTASQPTSYWEHDSSDRPSLHEQRGSSSIHRIFNDPRWSYSTGDQTAFQQRVPVPQHRFPDDYQRYVPTSPTSDTASMAIVGESRSTYYGSLASSRDPSLISSGSTRRESRSSVRIDPIGSMPNYYQLEEDDNGILSVPESRRGTLQCPCSPLGCEEWFDSPVEWESHYQAHFRGRLPRTIECPFQGCDEVFQGERSRDAWRTRWSHMLSCRYRTSGVKPRLSRSLVDHLWRSGIISSAEEQQLRQTGTLNSSSTYLTSTTDSRERRRERRPERRSRGEGGSGYYSSRR